MKKLNFTQSGLLRNLGFCISFVLFLVFSNSGLQAQNLYGIPNLKPVNEAVASLSLAYNAIAPQAKQSGPGSQAFITAELYLRLIDAMNNRADVNMKSYDVLLSSMDMNRYNQMVVKQGNAINLDATIRNVLATPEYQSAINEIKQ